jgi:hypothetical protein
LAFILSGIGSSEVGLKERKYMSRLILEKVTPEELWRDTRAEGASGQMVKDKSPG